MKPMTIVVIAFLGTLLSVSVALAGPVDLATFKEKAGTNRDRCIGARDWNYCKAELDYALQKGLITPEAYEWGKATEHYPVINRYDVIQSICTCGCFEGDTLVLLTPPEGNEASYVKVRDMTEEHKAWALDSEATLSDLSLAEFPVDRVIAGPEDKAFYIFNLANDRTLKLTQHHGTVLSDGTVVAAKDVAVGQSFISADTGEAVPILAIEREVTSDKVYNFRVASDDKVNHIVVAEGVLVGDLAWQNSLSSELGQVHIRD